MKRTAPRLVLVAFLSLACLATPLISEASSLPWVLRTTVSGDTDPTVTDRHNDLAWDQNASAPAPNSAQDDTIEQFVAEIALEEFNNRLRPEADRIRRSKVDVAYGSFDVTHVQVESDWARIHIMSEPEILTLGDGSMPGPIFRGAVARLVDGNWQVYFENSPDFDSIRPSLPGWLSFLGAATAEVETPFQVPALPWAVSSSWRLSNDLHLDFNGSSTALDFAVNPWNVSNAVHAMDGGEIIDSQSTCLIIRRPDGLMIRYQHLDSSDVADWEPNDYVHMGDYLGNTTQDPGCDGPRVNHHVHIEFYNDDDDVSINPSTGGGSRLNDWRVSSSDGDLTKGNTRIEAGSGDDVFHRGCPDWTIAQEAAAVFDKKNCTGDWSLVFQKDNVVNVSGHVNGIESIKVRPGDAILLWVAQIGAQPACYDGSLWDLSKDYFPGTSISLWNNISFMQVVDGPCASQPIACAVNLNSRSSESSTEVTSCEQAEDPPAEEPPLPPGPQQKTTVKLRAYANYEGGVLFSGREGFSDAPSASGYSLEIPTGWSVHVYDQDGGHGSSRCFAGSVANLQDHGWHNRIQSIRIYRGINLCPTESPSASGPSVELYRHPDYRDRVYSKGVGFHDNLDPVANSLKVPAGWSVVAYRGDKRQVRAQCFNHNVPNLANTGSWENKIRGIEVFDRDVCTDSLYPNFDWLLHIDEGFRGDNRGSTAPYEMPRIRDVGGLDMNDKISSIRIRAGYSIKVWEHDDFQGGSRCFSESVTTMRNDAFDNGQSIYVFPQDGVHDGRISSFKVYPNHYCDASPAMPDTGWAYSDSPTIFARSLEENSSQSVTIKWVDSATDEEGYRIYEFDQEDYKLIGEVGRNRTSFTHTNLTCGTSVHYLVKSFNKWGESATPHLMVANTADCFVPPALLSEMNAISNPEGDGDFSVSWKPVPGATGYELQERFETNTWQTVQNVVGTSHQFVGKENGTWCYRVRAVNGNQIGDWSTPECTVKWTGTGATSLASRHTDGTQGTKWSTDPAVSPDGRYVVFNSASPDLVDNDTNGRTEDVFLHDRQTGQTFLISRPIDGSQGSGPSSEPSISAEGKYVVYGYGGMTYLYSRESDTSLPVFRGGANHKISADGTTIAFHSDMENLVDDDSNGVRDVFVYDVQSEETTLVSVNSDGSQMDKDSELPSISGNGRYVAFISGDYRTSKVFVHDLETGITELVSRDTNGTVANGKSFSVSISSDGQVVAFQSDATNMTSIAPSSGRGQLFVHDRNTHTTTLASRHSDGTPANYSTLPALAEISGNGRYVVFQSDSNNLVDDDSTSASPDIFAHDLRTGATTLLSRGSSGLKGNAMSITPAVSHDGQVVVFASQASNLVDPDNNRDTEVFIRVWPRSSSSSALHTDILAYGSGQSADAVWLATGFTQAPFFNKHWGFREDRAFDELVPGDFNGDGLTDILAYNRGPGADMILLATGTGQAPFFTRKWGFQENLSFDQLIPGDFNGDGLTDILAYGRGQARDAIWLARGTGSAPFFDKKWGFLENRSFDDLIPGDFNGDGYTDIVAYGSGSRPDAMWLATGSSNAPFFSKQWGFKEDRHFDQLVPGDFNGDGFTDILAYGRGTQADAIWFANGVSEAPFFTKKWGFRENRFYDRLVSGDFNGDRLYDIVAYGSGSRTDTIWFSTGTSSAPYFNKNSGFREDAAFEILITGNFDNR